MSSAEIIKNGTLQTFETKLYKVMTRWSFTLLSEDLHGRLCKESL